MIMTSGDDISAIVMEALRSELTLETRVGIERGQISNAHTALSISAMWPSPARMQRQGCSSCAGSRLQMRTVVSSEDDAMIEGSEGQVVRSLIP